jgi:hypothetical protein
VEECPVQYLGHIDAKKIGGYDISIYLGILVFVLKLTQFTALFLCVVSRQ